jgi:broad specificity phosphatase PhoE
VEIILIRHAQPAWVVDGKSILDPHLTEHGLSQAEQLGQECRDWSRPSELFVSPTLRSRQTAAPLAQAWGLAEKVLPWLEELRLPPAWDGAPAPEVGQQIREGRHRAEEEWWDGPPGGESFHAFHHRISAGLSAMLEERGVARVPGAAPHLWSKDPGEHRLAVVAHAGTNSVILSELLGLPKVPWLWERFGAMHASVTRVRIQELLGGYVFSLRVFSDVSHLPKNARSR